MTLARPVLVGQTRNAPMCEDRQFADACSRSLEVPPTAAQNARSIKNVLAIWLVFGRSVLIPVPGLADLGLSAQ